MSKVLAVVPTYVTEPGDLELLMTCLVTLLDTAGDDCEVLVVDDGSPVPALVDEIEGLTSRLKVELHRKPENTGFSKTVNVGLRRALTEDRDAVLVNADVEFMDRAWLRRMVAQPRQDGEGPAGVVGGLLLYPNGLIQHGGIYFSLLTRSFDHRYRYGPGDLPEALNAYRCPVTGALQFIRHDVLAKVGLYDENFLLGWEDVDYCIRAFQAGHDCVYQPKVRAFHHESVFRGRPSPRVQEWQAKSWVYLMKKYAGTGFQEWVPSII